MSLKYRLLLPCLLLCSQRSQIHFLGGERQHTSLDTRPMDIGHSPAKALVVERIISTPDLIDFFLLELQSSQHGNIL